MRKSLSIVLTLFSLQVYGLILRGQQPADIYEYLSPKPFSAVHNPETVILIRYGEKVDVLSITDELINVVGEASGIHNGKFTVSKDNQTLIFTPEKFFSLNEKVTIQFREGIQTKSGKSLPSFEYWFTIRCDPVADLLILAEKKNVIQESTPIKPIKKSISKGDPLTLSDFNIPVISFSNNPSKGNIMTTLIEGFTDYIYIFNNEAIPIYARIMPHRITNLRPHPKEQLTYYDSYLKAHIVLDSCLETVDTLRMKNNYKTDSHEILLLENGHTILISYDPRIIDMSELVEGGNPAATVTGLVIQELDEEQNLIFQWRSWDYFSITDSYADLHYSVVDYVHGNSLDADTDTTLILTSRNLNEVTKINRLTGKIIWRLGGKKNEFVFENDPRLFAGQHTALKQKNGTLTMFDNGVGLDPLYSRGIEYEIDENNKKVKLVHEYRNSPDIYANVSGNLQRLDNGNTFIFWGSANIQEEQLICEYDMSGNEIFKASFDLSIHPNYRAYRSMWEPRIFTFNTDTLSFKSTVQSNPLNRELKIKNNSGNKITITSFYHKNLGFNVTGLPLIIEAGSEATVTVTFPSNAQSKISDNIYFCMETDSLLVTRSLFVTADIIQGTGFDNQVQNGYKVKPNPSEGLFNVETPQTRRNSLWLTDLSGKIILKEKDVANDLYQIDLCSRPDGLYLLFIKEERTGLIHYFKLIKQN